MYEVLVARMRRDLVTSLARQPTTLQTLVCERTAFNYVMLKQKESLAVGAVGGFRHMTEVKEFNAFWMGLAEQLNKMMQAGNSEYRDNLLRSVGSVLASVIAELVPDPAARRLAIDQANLALAAAGL